MTDTGYKIDGRAIRFTPLAGEGARRKIYDWLPLACNEVLDLHPDSVRASRIIQEAMDRGLLEAVPCS